MQVDTQTKERPILFSAEMVRAILGRRKTQTRRVMKVAPPGGMREKVVLSRCPYGTPGDRLWVRETWAMMPECHPVDSYPIYRATDPGWDDNKSGLRWKPSIHMPRWASRITLEITGVRVERVQDISTTDCWDEGITASIDVNPRHEFIDLWESINGHDSWDANPWVWVVEFRVIEPEATP